MGYTQAEMFPSKYLAAEDFREGEQRVVAVKDVSVENFDNKRTGKQERKYILELRGEKPLILNKTNASAMFELLGQDTDDWLGKSVTLIVKIVDSFGEEKPAIRVKTVLPESDPRLRQQPSSQGGSTPGVVHQQTAMPTPPQTGEPMVTATQKTLLVREAQRVWGEVGYKAKAREQLGNIADLTHQNAKEWIGWLKSQPDFKAIANDDWDDSDPFADDE